MNSLDRINLTKISLDKHTFILKAGTVLYRVIIGHYDPKIPTGQQNRCAKNPYDLEIPQYQRAFLVGQGAICGTGNNFCSISLATAYKEVEKHYGPEALKFSVAHKIVLRKDITAIDTIYICISEGINPTPGEDHPFWHSFYGPPIQAQALKLKSCVDVRGENIVLFPHNIPDYLNSISSEECSGDEKSNALKINVL